VGKALGFPETTDFNGRDPEGFGEMQFTLQNDRRIGPSDHLKTLGVKIRVDLPVGQSLQAPALFFWARRGPSEFRSLMRADRVARAMIVGYLLGTGPATMVPGVCAFVRSEASLPRP
jgi:4-pyridoxate dehydrogenase